MYPPKYKETTAKPGAVTPEQLIPIIKSIIGQIEKH